MCEPRFPSLAFVEILSFGQVVESIGIYVCKYLHETRVLSLFEYMTLLWMGGLRPGLDTSLPCSVRTAAA